MAKNIHNIMTVATVALLYASCSLHASLIIESIGETWEGTSDSTADPLIISIDGAGNASNGSTGMAFDVTGSLATANESFTFALDAYKNVNTSDGTKLSDGIMDVDGIAGDGNAEGYGVATNPNSGGIGNDGTNREGYGFYLDTSSMSIGLRLTRILLENFDDVGGGESAFVHNISTGTSIEFGAGTDPLWLDVSGLNITLAAGEGSTHIATLYSGDTGGFRIDGWEFDTVVPEPTTLAYSVLGLLSLLARRRRDSRSCRT